MAVSFRDKTFCASTNCQNKCGRKMSDHEREQIMVMQHHYPDEVLPVCYGYFCGEPSSEAMSMEIECEPA